MHQLMSLAHFDTGSANSVYVSVCLSNLLPKKQGRNWVNANRQRTEVDVKSAYIGQFAIFLLPGRLDIFLTW